MPYRNHSSGIFQHFASIQPELSQHSISIQPGLVCYTHPAFALHQPPGGTRSVLTCTHLVESMAMLGKVHLQWRLCSRSCVKLLYLVLSYWLLNRTPVCSCGCMHVYMHSCRNGCFCLCVVLMVSSQYMPSSMKNSGANLEKASQCMNILSFNPFVGRSVAYMSGKHVLHINSKLCSLLAQVETVLQPKNCFWAFIHK